MGDILNLKRTSGVTVEATDIIIRETKTTRLILRPLVIDGNGQDSVKCWIIAQRKGLSEKWEEENELPLSSLKKGEWAKFELKTNDVTKILGALSAIKEQYKKYGVLFSGKYSLIEGEEAMLLEELSKFDRELLIKKLKDVKPEHLENLSETIKLTRLEKLIKEIKENA